jgi:sulfur carrier protein
MTLTLNGNTREFAGLAAGATLQQLLDELQLKGDRIAVEHNGAIVARAAWTTAVLQEDDRLEIVHFVGGGCALN